MKSGKNAAIGSTPRRWIRCLCFVAGVACLIAFVGIVWLDRTLPDSFLVVSGCSLNLGGSVRAETVKTADRDSEGEVTLQWLGVIPIKRATVTAVERRVVLLGGMPFGIKLYTEGVLVVGLSDVDTASGTVNPARSAGIRVNDRILSVNGTAVDTAAALAAAIRAADGKPVALRINRDGITFNARLTPVRSVSERTWKMGLWVRDSSAGIGTVTFYDPETSTFAGLGHAICDVDTGTELPIRSGEAVTARIFGVVKGKKGTPGELCGGFDGGHIGEIVRNCTLGLYGRVDRFPAVSETVEVAMKQDVVRGEAWIYTTLDGTVPAMYRINIEEIRYADNTATRNLVIAVTDEKLLSKAGGIVQGMSGSPILQNGRLVGAVTHVLVNDPTRGYGVFAENMLKTALTVADEIDTAA